MDKLYRAAGTVDRDFVGQITYTICLDHPLHELDIEFSFDKQRFQESDVTPALIAETAQICREKYGLTGTEDDVRDPHAGDHQRRVHRLRAQAADPPAHALRLAGRLGGLHPPRDV